MSKTGLQSAQQLPAELVPDSQKAGDYAQQNDDGVIVSALSASPMAQSSISGRASDAPHNNFMMTQEMLDEVKKYGDAPAASNLRGKEEKLGELEDQNTEFRSADGRVHASDDFERGLQNLHNLGMSEIEYD